MTVGADIQITEIDKSMRDGVGVLFDALDGQHFLVAGIGRLEVT